METETHLIDRDNHLHLTKVDLFKHSDQLVGFKVMCYDRVVECHLDEENNPIFSLRRLVDDDRPHILKEGFSNVGKLWSDEEIEDLKQLFVSEDGDLVKISEKMERTQQGIRLRLRSMGLIDEKDQKIEVSSKTRTPKKKPKTKYGKFTQSEEDELRFLFTETKGNIKQISEEMNRTEKSIRMKLWFLDLIDEEDVNWLDKLQRKDFPNETKEE